MSGRFDVVGVGYTAFDCLGIVPHLPAPDSKLEIERFEIHGGGPAATATVTAARLGLKTAFIGTVGDDPFGGAMLAELRRERIDVSAVVVQPGRLSQFAFIMVDRDTAARTILWTRGTLEPLAPGRLDADLIRSCRGLLVDTMEPGAGAAAAALARESGVTTLLDAGTLREGVRDILPHSDYIVASETFAGQLSGGRGPRAALDEMMAYGPRAAVVTLGGRGCVARSAEGDVRAEGFAVDAVDTTGAGDVFHGAFLYAALAGWDTRRCCVFANAVAAMKCRALGGRPAIPSLDEALAFLGERVPDLDFPPPARR